MSGLMAVTITRRVGAASVAIAASLLAMVWNAAWSADTPYIVGDTDVMSGALASYGGPLLAGAQVYFNAINAKGGINGRKIELRSIDNQADASKVVASIQDLAAAHAVAIMGLSLSLTAEAGGPLANQLHVPLFSNGLTPRQFTPFEPYVFSHDIVPAPEPQMQIDFIRTQLFPGKSDLRVALLGVAVPGILAYGAILKDLMASQQPGWKMVDEEYLPLTASDFGVLIAKIVGAKPDVVIFSLADAQAQFGIKALLGQGLRVPFVGTHAGGTEKTFTGANYSDYYALRQYPTTQDTDTGPGYAEMIKDFKTAGLYDGLTSTYNAISGYVAALTISAILKGCAEPCTGEAMQKATLSVGSIDTGGITFKPISFSPTRHLGMDTERPYHAVDGHIAPVGSLLYSGTYGHP